MSKDLELKAWLVQEAAFDYYKHGQKGPVSQDDDVRAYLQLYQLLDDVEANKSQPDELLVGTMSRKIKRQQRTRKVKALSVCLVVALLAAASIITFFAVANKSVLLGSVVDAAPWVLMAVTITAIVITALGFNKILIRRR